MRIKSLFVSLMLMLALLPLQAQELNITFQINDAQIDVADKRVFREMERAFANFMNNTRWTEQAFEFNEKIRASMQLTINTMPSVGIYSGTMVIRSMRPVYNTSYSTSVFTFVDRDFNFNYVESQPLDFNINTFNNNITSMLAFYAYVILGMDGDSFERLGGTPYFEQARTIAQVAQQQGGVAGWDPAQGGNAARSKAALIDNLLNTRLQPLREFMYSYHRLALDTFLENADGSRKLISDGLAGLKQVRDYNPSAILLIAFFDSKATELSNMFRQGAPQLKQQAYTTLIALDPSNTDKYSQILR